jgi:hypothetical protein
MRWTVAVWIALSALFATYIVEFGKTEQDIVSSLERSLPDEAAIFHQIQGSGFFQDQVYILPQTNDPARLEELQAVLKRTGYGLSQAFEPQLEDPRALYPLLPYLPQKRLDYLLGPAYREALKTKVKEWIETPGGLGMLRLIERDPLLLSREIPALLHKDLSITKPLVAKRSTDLDWAKARELYEYLSLHAEDFSFLGGDFYALENYEVVRHDIWLCSLLSTLLGLLIFRMCCRQWSLLLFLIAGTAFSALFAVALTNFAFASVYGLVLAFASTFASFNNETLVHLAGVDWNESKGSRVGIFSALGTTILGFFVLLFSSSYLTRQLAVLSLGSLLAFLVFLWSFRRRLETFRFRPINLPACRWQPRVLYGSFAGLLIAMALLPKPLLRTRLEEFRYASTFLTQQTERFASQVKTLSLEQLYAVPKANFRDALTALDGQTFHPLQLYRSAPRALSLDAPLKALAQDLTTEGLNLSWKAEEFTPHPLSRSEYLRLWQRIWPLPWETPNHLLVFLKPGSEVKDAVPMHPRIFYEFILNELSANLFWLFLIGLGLMLLYLLPWQRSLQKIALVFLPLLVALLGLQLLFWQSGRTLTILHIMGLALVIAVALDYGAVLVSNDHGPIEQGKVLLTGALTLSSFGSLLLADHPVLRELALIVFVGTALSWMTALFIRIQRKELP